MKITVLICGGEREIGLLAVPSLWMRFVTGHGNFGSWPSGVFARRNESLVVPRSMSRLDNGQLNRIVQIVLSLGLDKC